MHRVLDSSLFDTLLLHLHLDNEKLQSVQESAVHLRRAVHIVLVLQDRSFLHLHIFSLYLFVRDFFDSDRKVRRFLVHFQLLLALAFDHKGDFHMLPEKDHRAVHRWVHSYFLQTERKNGSILSMDNIHSR